MAATAFYLARFSSAITGSCSLAARRPFCGRRRPPALVVMGDQDPDFPDPQAEADWIARALRAQVVLVPEAGRYPRSQRPDITTGAVLRFLESVKSRA
jgi:pimeloyl-ACP methyl ester carboxylesterase